MKISIGADHRGYVLKKKIITYFDTVQWADVGTFDPQRSDYPIFASKVCQALVQGEAEKGILICGSGLGMVIAANRHHKIYATLCWNVKVARAARHDDDSNVLVLPGDFISSTKAFSIVKAWLETPFKGGHYQERLEMIDRSR